MDLSFICIELHQSIDTKFQFDNRGFSKPSCFHFGRRANLASPSQEFYGISMPVEKVGLKSHAH